MTKSVDRTGTRLVKVVKCKGEEHGDNPFVCICDLIGKVVEIDFNREAPWSGVVGYFIKGSERRVRIDEMESESLN